MTSGYNTTGQRTRLTYPAHGTWPTKRLKYTWDDYGRLSAVVDLAADGVTELETIASYAYSMGSRLVQTTRADNSKWSAPTATAWDGAARRTSAQVLGAANTVLFEEKMTFDKNDRVTRIDWPKGRLNATETEAQIFTYDELSRLTNFDQGLLAGTTITTLTSAHEWNLDELGNWRKHRDKSTNPNNPLVDVSVDPVNAYTAWPVDLNLDGTVQTTETATLNYDDARGFMVKQPDGSTSGWKYWHDGFGRLSQVDRCQNVACTGTPSWSVEYRYMADGRMATRKKNAEAATWYLYDGSQVIAEQTPTERSTWYVWSGSSLLQSARVLVANGSVDKLNLHQDRIGNVVLATRLNGSAVEMWGRLQFDPYGRKVSNITWEVNGVHVPYRFAGQRLDPDTGLYLMGARWYSAELGRFIEQDPIAEGGGLNLYAYTGSSPTMWVDPSGLRQEGSCSTPDCQSVGNAARENGYSVDGVNAMDPLTGGATSIVGSVFSLNARVSEAHEHKLTLAEAKVTEALAAASEDGGVAKTVVGIGAVIAVSSPEDAQAAVDAAMAEGKNIVVYAPGILNSSDQIATSAVGIADETGATVIALGNDSTGKQIANAFDVEGVKGSVLSAAVDLVEAGWTTMGGNSKNVALASAVLTPLNRAMEGVTNFSATVFAHSRGSADVDNAARDGGGFKNLSLHSFGGAASGERSDWKHTRFYAAADPVVLAAVARRLFTGRGDTGATPVFAVGHTFSSRYVPSLTPRPTRALWTDAPDAEKRPVMKR